jgi:ABC-type glycerol-3-phosphate transport system substrate-binding protein
MKFGFKFLFILVLCSIGLSACGGPKANVPIFMMGETGIPAELSQKLEESLKKYVGETPTISLNSSPIFSQEKMIVELAAGGNGIMILPEEQFQGIAQQGGGIILDSLFDPKEYPIGVVETLVDSNKPDGPKEKHLYGIPVTQTRWMKELGYTGKELIAFVHPRAPNLDMAKQVLKVIAEK